MDKREIRLDLPCRVNPSGGFYLCPPPTLQRAVFFLWQSPSAQGIKLKWPPERFHKRTNCCETTSGGRACLLFLISACCTPISASPGRSSRSCFSQTGTEVEFCREGPVAHREDSRFGSHLLAGLAAAAHQHTGQRG